MCRNALEYKWGEGVLTARSLIQSEQFDKGWDVLSKTYIKKLHCQRMSFHLGKNNQIMMSAITTRSTPVKIATIGPNNDTHPVR